MLVFCTPFIVCSISFGLFVFAQEGAKDRAHVHMEGSQPWLELLLGISGAFRPKVLTCLMGVTGAGKTTLMDVLAGRKTGNPQSRQNIVFKDFCEVKIHHIPLCTNSNLQCQSVAAFTASLGSVVFKRACSMLIEEIMVSPGYTLLSWCSYVHVH